MSKASRLKTSKSAKKFNKEHAGFYREIMLKWHAERNKDPEVYAKRCAQLDEARKKSIEANKRKWDAYRIQKEKERRNAPKVANSNYYNPKFGEKVDVHSKLLSKERDYLHKICQDIMQPWGLEPMSLQSYMYYEEIVEYFRPGWLHGDRIRRYGFDPLEKK